MPPVQAHFLESYLFTGCFKIVVNYNKCWMCSFPIMAKSPGREMQYKKNGVLVVLLGLKSSCGISWGIQPKRSTGGTSVSTFQGIELIKSVT